MAMNTEITFRTLFLLAFICMFGIRIASQLRARRAGSRVRIREKSPSLIAGGLAALFALTFGAEYLFTPGAFGFAYALEYPDSLRWAGAGLLFLGIALLAAAHYHLDLSFHSLVVTKADQKIVRSGPYRWIRHPIYSAYLMNYLGGGLLAGNLVLTIVPVLLFGVLVALRVGPEEQAMVEQFGEEYRAYMNITGRFIPKLGGNS
jgi:protein-S-isoprenylcysteine O-methyltransferase Ste14